MGMSITGWWFVGALVTAALGTLVASLWVRRRHRWIARSCAVGTAGLVVLSSLAGANAHFAYYPTLGSLLGQTKDRASLASIASHLGQRPAGAVTARSTEEVGALVPDHGSVVDMAIPATASGFSARSATVYLPPLWFASPRPSLPVVELLHGTPGMPQDWARGGGVPELADAWARDHGGWAPIFVMPDANGAALADTECVDGKQGRAETYLTTDVRTFAVGELGARPDAPAWIVGGLSEGGYCGAMLALRHPDLFSAFLDFGGDDHPSHLRGASALFVGSPQQVASQVRSYSLGTLLKDPRVHGQRGWVISAADDQHAVRVGRAFAAAASAAGVDVRTVVLPHGGHTFRTWRDCLATAFPDAVGGLMTPHASL